MKTAGKGKGKAVPVLPKKTYGGVEVDLRPLLISILD
jgi:hypothetical protein